MNSVPSYHLIRRLSLAALLLALLAPAATAQSTQQPIRRVFIIEADGTAEKRLATVREYVEQQRWDAALDLLREVREGRPGAMIRVARNRSLALSRYCDILLSQFPPAGIAAYRQDVDPQASAWLDDWRETGNARFLERIVETLFVSSAGDEALDALAERAWERGEIALARHYWTMLVPVAPPPDGAPPDRLAILRYPDTGFDLATIRARLVMCSIALGEQTRAARELRAFRELHPNAHGWIAGGEGPLADRLAALLPGQSNGSPLETRWISQPQPHGTMTFGSHPNRDGALAFDPQIAMPGWSRPLPISPYATDPERPALPTLPPLATYPAIWRDKVFVASGGAIHGFEQATGNPAWSDDPAASAQIYPPVIAPTAEDSESPQPHSPRAGVPRHSLTIAGDYLFARLGPPLTSWPERVELRREETTLVCLDLEDQGRLVWTLAAEALDEENERWSFEGPPVAVDDKLFVLASRSQPRPSLQLVCIRAKSGAVLWKTSLGTPLNLPPAGTAVMSHRLVAYAARRLYVATDQGAVICLDAEQGAFQWIGWYESRPPAAPPPVNLADRGLPAACLVAAGVVVVAPNDSDALLAFDAFSGRLLWRREIRGGGRQLLGARDTTLVVAGQRLHGLELASGRVLWTIGYEDPPGFGAGKGLLGAEFAYWPTREDLLIVDWRTGQVERRIRLHHVFNLTGGGNLAASPNGLFLAGPGYLVGFPAIDSRHLSGQHDDIESNAY